MTSTAASSLTQSLDQSHFEKQLISMMNHFLLYENRINQTKALAYVPLEDLTLIARAKYDSCPKDDEAQTEDPELIVRDLLLLELLNWFKTEFFSWMDSPRCPICSQKTTALGNGLPTTEEATKSASRVELFTCQSCYPDRREVSRFPRYNDPSILLGTRIGRCGEWANCFALVCRAIGFEVRHVTDWTDHVWVEVYSSGQKPNRWLHIDPCENSCDNPLLYESGWGKNLSYVIAVSQDDIQDVTWRYTHMKNQAAVLARRNLCNEVWLVSTIIRLRAQKQAWLPIERKQILSQRLIYELVEFLTPRSHDNAVKESEMVGRESGSLAWRLARQELGVENADVQEENFEWEITEQRIKDELFLFGYNCFNDTYFITKTNGSVEHMKGWQNGTFEASNIFRKEESDWKMTYLARKEHSNSQKAKVSWKFTIPSTSPPESKIVSAKISIQSAKFHPSAKILVTICTNTGDTLELSETDCSDGLWTWDSTVKTQGKVLCLDGVKSVVITCQLQGGDGSSGWQHAQLFREKMPMQHIADNVSNPAPFTVIFKVNQH